MHLTPLTAAKAAATRDGTPTSEDLVEACLARIGACEETVGAWAFLDPDHALHLGEHVKELQFPQRFDLAAAWYGTLPEADLAGSFEREYARGKDKPISGLRERIERGQRVLAVDYN